MVIRLEGDSLPDEARGAIVPVLLGDGIHLDVRGIPLQVGYQLALADNCGLAAIAELGTIELSGPDIARVWTKIGFIGLIQIDNEWLYYSAKLEAPYRLVLYARGVGPTDPAEHSKGATVYFVEPKPIYAFAVVPSGHSYPADAFVQMRIDGVAQVPFYTVRLADDRINGGFRLVTAQFDLTRPFGFGATGGAGSGIVIAGGSDAPLTPRERAWARKARRLRRQGTLPRATVRSIAPIAGGSVGIFGYPVGYGIPGQVTGSTKSGSSGLNRNRALMPLPPPPPPPPAAKTEPKVTKAGAAGPSQPAPSQAVQLLQLPLGRVSADIRSLLDTTDGRYTGVANGAMTRPAQITRMILERGYPNQADSGLFDLPAWESVATRQAGLGYTWQLRWEGEELETFRQRAGYCGQADIFVTDDGLWTTVFRESQRPVVASITERERLGDVELAFVPASNTKLDVTFGAGLSGGAFTLTSPGRAKQYGTDPLTGAPNLALRTLELPYIVTEKMARQVARHWLSQWDHQRHTANIGLPHGLIQLTRTDRIFVSSAVLELYGDRRVPMEIRGTNDRGETRMISLIEADPLALETPLSGTLVHVVTFGLPLTGTFQPAVMAVLSGSLFTPSDYFGGRYFGGRYFGDRYFG